MEEMPNVVAVGGKAPEIDPTAYLDPSARVIGNVIVEPGAAIYPGCILRAEDAAVFVRRNAVVLDMCFIEAPKGSEVTIGEASLISHNVTIHGAQVGPSTLVGIGSILLDRAVVGRECIVSAGSLVPPKKQIDDRSLVVGAPAKFKRRLEEADIARIRSSHAEAWEKARVYGQMYGAAPMEGMTGGIGDIKVDGDVFSEAPDRLKRKMGRQFQGTDFDTEGP